MDPLLPDRDQALPQVAHRYREQLLSRIAAGGDALPAPALPTIPGYRVLGALGEGTSGEVFEATAEGEDRPVAIKLFRAGSRSLLREFRASERVDHPGVVQVLATGETEDHRAFLVMERVPGEDLAALLRREGPLPWTRARSLLLQLCDAMACAHERGVIHRDLKPTNIIVWREEEEATDGAPERCTVVDLGLSRLIGDGVVSSIDGSLVGTPAYMSPEQIRGRSVDGRIDVYALGCIAYEMLTGLRPFPGQTPGELAVQHLTMPAPRLHGGRSRGLPRALDAVLAKALAKDPQHRYADMNRLAAALRAIPVHGGPGSGARNGLGFRRGVMLAAGGSLAVAAFVVTLGRPPHQDEPARVPPPPTPPPARITSIATGLGHTCAVDEGGRLQCWGSDALGRLGRGTDGEHIGDDEFPADHPPLPLTSLVRVATAGNARHSCALNRYGKLWCWGDGSFGALGQGGLKDFGDNPGETLDTLPPLPLPPVVDVALSTARTCVITAEEEQHNLYCWGHGAHGALGSGSVGDLGDNESLDTLPPVPLGTGVRGVAAGNDHTCAVLETGGVRCWGSNDHGQLGIPGWSANVGDGVGNGIGYGRGQGGRPDDPSRNVVGLDGVDVVDIDAGGNRTCVLTAEGGVRCWGSNSGHALGYRWSDIPYCGIEDPAPLCPLRAALPFDVDLGDLEGAELVALSTGQRHTCVLDSEGSVRCWGSNRYGQLGTPGTGDVGHYRTPAEIWAERIDHGIVDLGDDDGDGWPDRATAISAGYAHTCALMETGGVRCWGNATEGRLGYGTTDHITDLSPGAHYRIHGRHDVPIFTRPETPRP